jgi:hypothetical protein
MKMTSLERDERMKITIGAVVIEPKKQRRLWVSSWSMSSPKLSLQSRQQCHSCSTSSLPRRDGRSLFSRPRPDGCTASKMMSHWPFTLTCCSSPCPRLKSRNIQIIWRFSTIRSNDITIGLTHTFMTRLTKYTIWVQQHQVQGDFDS